MLNPSDSNPAWNSPAGDALQAATSKLPGRTVRIVLAAAFVALAASCLLFVDETEYVIVETLGRITAVYDQAGPKDSDRGLHFKAPWPIGTVRRFDRRQQLYDPPGRETFTHDKKNLTVHSYVCWKIAATAAGAATNLEDRPVVRFYRGVGNAGVAEARLDARVRSILAAEIGQVDLGQLLAARSSEAGPGDNSPIAAVAERILTQLRRRSDEAQGLLEKLGMDIVDLRIKRINLPEGNRFAVYERMRTERLRIAERYRSAGRAEKVRIESQARRQSEELLAKAAADAERIRGEGEAEAIGILNRAHAADPDFYEFQRTLAGYARILNDKTTLVLSAASPLLKLLTTGVRAASPGPDDEPPASSLPGAAEQKAEARSAPQAIPAAAARESNP